jgi:2-alkenal reductase
MLKNKHFLVVLITLLLTALACSTSTNIGSLLLPTATLAPATTLALPPTLVPAAQPAGTSSNNQPDLLASLYERVSPGVVSIQVLMQNGGGQGSGFIYSNEGYIITNEHVVDQATDIFVNFTSGLKVRGKVVANDLDSDLAVIKVDVPAEKLTPLTLGDSDQVKVGQTVVAIGNPYGLSGTMTSGIVSAKGRTLESLHQTSQGGAFSAGDIIQTDASINPGNSGGPLINLNGDVIGINRAIRTSGTLANGDPVNTGIGFAIPINIVKKVMPTLIKTGHYDYPYLGLTAQEELTLPEIELLKLPQTTGAYVVNVIPGGPADKAGLHAGTQKTEIDGLLSGGDLLIGVDGRPVRVFGDLLGYLMDVKSPGDTIKVTILRDGKQQDLEVKLDKRPQ